MHAMVDATRTPFGHSKPASLLDLGYTHAGLDDNWQACGAGVDGSFHAADGTPLINLTRFPSMKSMVATGHRLGLKVGWCKTCGASFILLACRLATYLHPCARRQMTTIAYVARALHISTRHRLKTTSEVTSSTLLRWSSMVSRHVAAPFCVSPVSQREHERSGSLLTAETCRCAAFNALCQADGCGPGRDLPTLAALLNATGRPVLIENCHYYKWPNSSLPKGVGPDRVNRVWPYWKDNVTGGELICPENLFRASGDIANSWTSWFGNLATLAKYQDEQHPISRPGCWACKIAPKFSCELFCASDPDKHTAHEHSATRRCVSIVIYFRCCRCGHVDGWCLLEPCSATRWSTTQLRRVAIAFWCL